MMPSHPVLWGFRSPLTLCLPGLCVCLHSPWASGPLSQSFGASFPFYPLGCRPRAPLQCPAPGSIPHTVALPRQASLLHCSHPLVLHSNENKHATHDLISMQGITVLPSIPAVWSSFLIANPNQIKVSAKGPGLIKPIAMPTPDQPLPLLRPINQSPGSCSLCMDYSQP